MDLRIPLYLPNNAPAHGTYKTDKAPNLSETEGDEPDFDVSFDLSADQTDYLDFFV